MKSVVLASVDMEGANVVQVNIDALTTAARPISFVQKMGHAFAHLTSHDVVMNAARLTVSARNLDVFPAHFTGSAMGSAAQKASSAQNLAAADSITIASLDVHRTAPAFQAVAFTIVSLGVRPTSHAYKVVAIHHLVRSGVRLASHA